MSKQRVPLFRQADVSRCRNIGTLLSKQCHVEPMGRSLHIYFFKVNVTLNDLRWNRYNKIPIYYHVVTSFAKILVTFNRFFLTDKVYNKYAWIVKNGDVPLHIWRKILIYADISKFFDLAEIYYLFLTNTYTHTPAFVYIHDIRMWVCVQTIFYLCFFTIWQYETNYNSGVSSIFLMGGGGACINIMWISDEIIKQLSWNILLKKNEKTTFVCRVKHLSCNVWYIQWSQHFNYISRLRKKVTYLGIC